MPIDKVAARIFAANAAAALAALNASDPPVYTPNVYLSVYRHPCGVRKGRSSALGLHEMYQVDPGGSGAAFLYKEGTCRGCGALARSPSGRVVDTELRPPLSGRATRRVS